MKKVVMYLAVCFALLGMVLPSFAQETSPEYVDILSAVSTVREAYPEGIIVEVSFEETTTPICWLVEVYDVALSDDSGEAEDVTVCVDALTGSIATEWSYPETEEDDETVEDDVEVDESDEDVEDDSESVSDDVMEYEDAFIEPTLTIEAAIEAALRIYPAGLLKQVTLFFDGQVWLWSLEFDDDLEVIVEDSDGDVLDYGYDLDYDLDEDEYEGDDDSSYEDEYEGDDGSSDEDEYEGDDSSSDEDEYEGDDSSSDDEEEDDEDDSDNDDEEDDDGDNDDEEEDND